jgi:hypothetical protein
VAGVQKKHKLKHKPPSMTRSFLVISRPSHASPLQVVTTTYMVLRDVMPLLCLAKCSLC